MSTSSTDSSTAEAVNATESDEQTTDTLEVTADEQTTDDEPGGREAAKLRKRAQAAESDRDTARGQLDELRRQVVEQASGLQKPAGLWAAGTDVGALFTEAGTLDPDALKLAVTEASDKLGLARRLSNYVPSEGGNPRPTGRSGWSDALKHA